MIVQSFLPTINQKITNKQNSNDLFEDINAFEYKDPNEYNYNMYSSSSSSVLVIEDKDIAKPIQPSVMLESPLYDRKAIVSKSATAKENKVENDSKICLMIVIVILNVFLPGVGTIIGGVQLQKKYISYYILSGVLQFLLSWIFVGFLWAQASSLELYFFI